MKNPLYHLVNKDFDEVEQAKRVFIATLLLTVILVSLVTLSYLHFFGG